MNPKLAQTRWNGMVSAPGKRYINVVFATANTSHPAATPALARGESITHIAHRLDPNRGQLRPEPTDVDVDDVRARVEFEPPHVGEQVFPGAYGAAAFDEITDKVEFAVRQRDAVVVDDEFVAGQVEPRAVVEHEAPGAAVRSRGGIAKAQSHPLQQFGVDERLGEIVDGAGLQCSDAAAWIRCRGQDEDPRVGLAVENDAHDLFAGQIRQHEIEQDQIELLGKSATQSRAGGTDRRDFIPR